MSKKLQIAILLLIHTTVLAAAIMLKFLVLV